MEELFSVEEAAKHLKVSVATVRRLIRAGKLKASKVGGQWRIRKSDLEALFQQPPEPPPESKPRK